MLLEFAVKDKPELQEAAKNLTQKESALDVFVEHLQGPNYDIEKGLKICDQNSDRPPDELDQELKKLAEEKKTKKTDSYEELLVTSKDNETFTQEAEKFMETHSVYEPISEEKKLLRTMIEKKEPGLVSKFLERIENRNCLKVLQEKDEDDNPSLFEACCKTENSELVETVLDRIRKDGPIPAQTVQFKIELQRLIKELLKKKSKTSRKEISEETNRLKKIKEGTDAWNGLDENEKIMSKLARFNTTGTSENEESGDPTADDNWFKQAPEPQETAEPNQKSTKTPTQPIEVHNNLQKEPKEQMKTNELKGSGLKDKENIDSRSIEVQLVGKDQKKHNFTFTVKNKGGIEIKKNGTEYSSNTYQESSFQLQKIKEVCETLEDVFEVYIRLQQATQQKESESDFSLKELSMMIGTTDELNKIFKQGNYNDRFKNNDQLSLLKNLTTHFIKNKEDWLEKSISAFETANKRVNGSHEARQLDNDRRQVETKLKTFEYGNQEWHQHNTKGGGNCLFHGIFGNAKTTEKYECTDIQSVKRTFTDKVTQMHTKPTDLETLISSTMTLKEALLVSITNLSDEIKMNSQFLKENNELRELFKKVMAEYQRNTIEAKYEELFNKVIETYLKIFNIDGYNVGLDEVPIIAYCFDLNITVLHIPTLDPTMEEIKLINTIREKYPEMKHIKNNPIIMAIRKKQRRRRRF